MAEKIKATTAPYNFVPLSDEVVAAYTDKKDLPQHNKIYGEGEKKLSGEITFSIEAITDIAIGGSKEGEFYKDTQGHYAIPGSSLRGLFRSNMQILGAGALGDDIEDFRYMYRKVGESKSKLSKRYKDGLLNAVQITVANKEKITVCKNIRAGYISNENGKYVLYNNIKTQSVDVEKNNLDYYPIRETEIFRNKYKYGNKNYDFLFDQKPSILQYEGTYDDFKVVYIGKCDRCYKVHNLNVDNLKKRGIDKFSQIINIICVDYSKNDNSNCDNEVKIRKHITGKDNKSYVPYYMEISYELENKRVLAIGNPGKYQEKGYVLSSGHMNEKKVIYIIPKIGNKIHQLSEDDIQNYKRDFENKKKRLGTTAFKDATAEVKKELCKKYEDFFQLPKEGEHRPVFYIHVGTTYYFGYTQYLRVFFKHSIKKGVPEAHKKFSYDYAKSIFGYSNNNAKEGQEESYKGRVYFEDATLYKKSPEEEDNLNKIKLTLESPKPSDYFDYLQQSEYKDNDPKKIKSYDDDFQIRGIKQYWFKEPKTPLTSEAIKDMSEFSYLKKGACFEAKVRFKNLTKDELGLLLWCIRLEKESQQNIGKAKAYGYGRIKIDKLEVKMLDLKKMYSLDSLDFNPFYACEQAEIDEYIKGYKEKIGESNKDSRNAFFIMKNAEDMPKEKDTAYMALENYKETKRHPLPTPNAVIKNEESSNDKNNSNQQQNKNSNGKNNGKRNSNSRRGKTEPESIGSNVMLDALAKSCSGFAGLPKDNGELKHDTTQKTKRNYT